MSRRHTYTIDLSIGGDTPTWEGEVEFSYTVSFGRPAQTYGPPEKCYPAEADEIDDIRVEKIDGLTSGWAYFQSDASVAEDMIERLTERDYELMIEEAAERDYGDDDR